MTVSEVMVSGTLRAGKIETTTTQPTNTAIVKDTVDILFIHILLKMHAKVVACLPVNYAAASVKLRKKRSLSSQPSIFSSC